MLGASTEDLARRRKGRAFREERFRERKRRTLRWEREVARRKRNTPLSIRKEQHHHRFLHTGGGIGHQDFGASPQGRLLPQPPTHCHSQPSGPSRLRLVSGLCRVGGCRGTALALSHTLLPFFRFCFTFPLFFLFLLRGRLNIYIHASGVALTNLVCFLTLSLYLYGLVTSSALLS